MSGFSCHATTLKDVYLIESKRFSDDRGYFMELYQEEVFKEMGLPYEFVQDNESYSQKGVLRGMHFQKVRPQGKLVNVPYGEVFDVAVDLRQGSPTYGKWEGFRLSSQNHLQLYIPEGFAHGYLTLSKEAIFRYKCTDIYMPQYDSGVLWNDETVGIKWPIGNEEKLIISEKDRNLLRFEGQQHLFKYEEKGR